MHCKDPARQLRSLRCCHLPAEEQPLNAPPRDSAAYVPEMAARIEKIASRLNRTILASTEFVRHLDAGWTDLGEFAVRLGRRHDLQRIGTEDAEDEFTVLALAGLDGNGGGPCKRIEPQFGLPLIGVGAVAVEAVLGQDGLNVPPKVDGRFCRAGHRNAGGLQFKPAQDP